MKKLLLLSAILLSACDDNSNQKSTNTNPSNNPISTSILIASTQKDAEYFKNNPKEIELVWGACQEALRSNKITDFDQFPGCWEAFSAKEQLEITAELKGDISADAFRRNNAQKISTHLTASNDCSPNLSIIPLDNPICKAVIEYARQLKAECDQNNSASCADSNELFRRLRIKE